MVLLGLAALDVAVSSASAEPTVSGIDIVEYGIYGASTTSESTGHSPGGVGKIGLNSLCHLATVTTVPLRQGVHFGFRFQVNGFPAGQIVDILKTLRLPAPMRPPGGAPFTVDGYTAKALVGTTTFTGFKFNTEWQLVPGPWSFELSHHGRKFAEIGFKLVQGVDVPITLKAKSACFRLP